MMVGEWFDDARFGLFVHWGIYSQLGHENAEWVLFKSRLDRNEYNTLADQFTASRFDPAALAGLAKSAGMRYMVLTTRHHDGFCLFDTATTTFNSVRTAARRDLVAEYVAACREAGLRVGLYYSIMSWQHPAIYTGPGADPKGWKIMVDETHDQVRELMTNYGKIDILWYDGAAVPGIQDNGMQARFWRSRDLNAMVKQLQPEILINPRSGLPADFDTPEQHVKPPRPGRRWEACITINRSWGYNIHDRDFKSPAEIVKCLIRCARHGGNLLLNIGPRGDGSIQPECITRLQAVGQWLKTNGEAIYGARRTPYTEANHAAGPFTTNGKRLYLHLASYPGPDLRIDGIRTVTAARLLADGTPLHVVNERPLRLTGLTRSMIGDLPTVLALDLPAAPGTPARLLGGGDEPRITAGNAPVLGDDPDRHAPPMVPVLTGEALAPLLRQRPPHRLTTSDAWCPGWHGQQLYTPQAGQRLQLTLDVPVLGRYDLNLGVITRTARQVTIAVDGTELPPIRLQNGVPDTLGLTNLRLTSGRRRLTISAQGEFGIYALRLSPVWRPLPSELWLTIGPFPTAFGQQRPVSDVLAAMRRVFPPEREFLPDAVYTGDGNSPVRWQHSRARRGEHTDCGVNFPYRCGTQRSGVCYARAIVTSPDERTATVLIGCDWWASLWVNGRRVRSERPAAACAIDGAQFNTWKPIPARIHLRQGDNIFLVKSHRGSNANWFSCRLTDPGDLSLDIPPG